VDLSPSFYHHGAKKHRDKTEQLLTFPIMVKVMMVMVGRGKVVYTYLHEVIGAYHVAKMG